MTSKMKAFGICAAAAVTFSQCALGWYSTPNTGVSWTMADLAALTNGCVTGAYPNYALHDDVCVRPNDTLTIPAGSVITRDDRGAWPTLVVQGRLVAKGTEAQQILLTSGSARGGSGDYDRCLEFSGAVGHPSNVVEWVTLENADMGAYVQLTNAVSFSNCRFRSCSLGILAQSSVTLADCQIACNTGGVLSGGAIVGGGIAVFRRCVVQGNTAGTATGHGGGIWLSKASGATIESCTITNNHAGIAGAGAWFTQCANLTVRLCRVQGNVADDVVDGFGGGFGFIGVTNAVIEGCDILCNKAQWGGGAYMYQCANVKVRQSLLSSNAAADYGQSWNGEDLQVEDSSNIFVERNRDLGYVFYYASSGRVVNNLFNARSKVGATYCSPLIAQNLFKNTYWSTQIDCYGGACPLVANNIFLITKGAVGEWSATGDPVLKNNVFGPSSHTNLYFNEASSWLTNAAAVNALSGNSGNFHADPLVDLANSLLASGSLCIDSGYPSGVADDYYEVPRPQDGNGDGLAVIDIGPFEHTDATEPPSSPLKKSLFRYAAQTAQTFATSSQDVLS